MVHWKNLPIGHLHYDISLLLRPESFRVLLSCANEGFCYSNLTGITKFKYERRNKKGSGRSSKITPSCKWPIACLQILLRGMGNHMTVHRPIAQALACVASVSSRGSAVHLENWDKSKKKMNDGGGGGEWRNRLPANPTILKNCVRPQTQLLIGAVRVVLIT